MGADAIRLIVITDWAVPTLRAKVEAVLSLGVAGLALQHRHPEASGRAFFEEAAWLAGVCAAAKTPLFVNGRLDVALAVNAHLHLPASSFRPPEVRAYLPGDRLISCAVHDADEVASAEGADLVLISPVFAPTSKPLDRRPTLGPDGFAKLASLHRGRAVALGGITPETQKGLPPGSPVAVMGAVWRGDPAATVRALLE